MEKINYRRPSGKIFYKSKLTYGKHERNFGIFAAEEFIATITQHILEKSFQLVRYYGWYSNRARGDRVKRSRKASTDQADASHAVELLDVSESKSRKIPSRTWRECIKKVRAVDPLACPKCGGELKIVSFIDERLVIRRILDCLGFGATSQAASCRQG